MVAHFVGANKRIFSSITPFQTIATIVAAFSRSKRLLASKLKIICIFTK